MASPIRVRAGAVLLLPRRPGETVDLVKVTFNPSTPVGPEPGQAQSGASVELVAPLEAVALYRIGVEYELCLIPVDGGPPDDGVPATAPKDPAPTGAADG